MSLRSKSKKQQSDNLTKEKKMEKQEIRIVTLPAMRIASFYSYSEYPETEGWTKVVRWAKAHDCWHEAPTSRVFGFDNPSPSEGSPNRGYEFWLTISPDVQPDEEIKIKEFSGGLYGVLHCDVKGDPFEIIPSAWQKLVKWLESSHYHYANHQYLEEHLSRTDPSQGGFVLDLYIPIAE
jgi:DNA gyrase inhibitor GyrI